MAKQQGGGDPGHTYVGASTDVFSTDFGSGLDQVWGVHEAEHGVRRVVEGGDPNVLVAQLPEPYALTQNPNAMLSDNRGKLCSSVPPPPPAPKCSVVGAPRPRHV